MSHHYGGCLWDRRTSRSALARAALRLEVGHCGRGSCFAWCLQSPSGFPLTHPPRQPHFAYSPSWHYSARSRCPRWAKKDSPHSSTGGPIFRPGLFARGWGPRWPSASSYSGHLYWGFRPANGRPLPIGLRTGSLRLLPMDLRAHSESSSILGRSWSFRREARMGADQTTEFHPARCPLCGEPNQCAVAADPEATECWCDLGEIPERPAPTSAR